MGWGEKRGTADANGGGTTGEIEEAHKRLDKAGVPRGMNLARRVQWLTDRDKRTQAMIDHGAKVGQPVPQRNPETFTGFVP